MKRSTVILAAWVGWLMIASAAEATPFTAIGDHDALFSWTPSATMSAVHDAPALVPLDPVDSAVVVGPVRDERFSVHVSELENPGDQLAFDLAALSIDPHASRAVPGPTVLALMGAGLAGLGLTLWRKHARVA